MKIMRVLIVLTALLIAVSSVERAVAGVIILLMGIKSFNSS